LAIAASANSSALGAEPVLLYILAALIVLFIDELPDSPVLLLLKKLLLFDLLKLFVKLKPVFGF
jgi:hypothetical protein